MTTYKLLIKNRNNKKICVLLNTPKNNSFEAKGLAIIMHGLGGYKEQPEIEGFSKTFVKSGYISLRFDARDTIGESEGNYENATYTSYYHDLEDVISWASKQKWYIEPFYILGHSLSGSCVSIYAQRNPEKIKGLAPIATVVNKKLSMTTYDKDKLAEWNRTGFQIRESPTKKGTILKLRWKPFLTDMSKFNVLKNSQKLTMPTIFIVGDKDTACPIRNNKVFCDKLKNKKEFHILKGAHHVLRERKHLIAANNILKKWISKMDLRK